MPYFVSSAWSTEDEKDFPELGRLIVSTRNLRPETFWDSYGHFEAFLKTDFVPRFLRRELQRIASTKIYDNLQSDDEVEILRADFYRVSMGKLRGGLNRILADSEVVCYANDFIYANLGPVPLEFDLFVTPDGQINEIFDKTLKPKWLKRVVQRRGDTLAIASGKHILRLVNPPVDVYQIYVVSSVQTCSMLWHYDAESLCPKYATSASLMSSRVQTALSILLRTGSSAALPVICAATQSRDHFVRWTAITAAGVLDADVGRDLLKRALEDIHPHVRSAARKSLARSDG